MIDYCDTISEQQKNPEAKGWFVQAANGNASAFEFMWQYWCWTHCIDDLWDRDKPMDHESTVRAFIKLLEILTFNAFYQAYKAQIFPLLVQMYARWLDGDAWEKSSDPRKRAASEVIRCGDVDLYLHCAYLCGGWDHQRKIKEMRSYDTNEQRSVA